MNVICIPRNLLRNIQNQPHRKVDFNLEAYHTYIHTMHNDILYNISLDYCHLIG